MSWVGWIGLVASVALIVGLFLAIARNLEGRSWWDRDHTEANRKRSRTIGGVQWGRPFSMGLIEPVEPQSKKDDVPPLGTGRT
jgi:hypothetical protein